MHECTQYMSITTGNRFIIPAHIVVTSLVINGESLDEISLSGRLRSRVLRDLMALSPTHSSYIQWLAYTHMKLPTLMIFIALEGPPNSGTYHKGCGNVLSLMSSIVIHGDDNRRAWFTHYMKLMQQKVSYHDNGWNKLPYLP